jgi:hypothetical protein
MKPVFCCWLVADGDVEWRVTALPLPASLPPLSLSKVMVSSKPDHEEQGSCNWRMKGARKSLHNTRARSTVVRVLSAPTVHLGSGLNFCNAMERIVWGFLCLVMPFEAIPSHGHPWPSFNYRNELLLVAADVALSVARSAKRWKTSVLLLSSQNLNLLLCNHFKTGTRVHHHLSSGYRR